MSAPPIGAVVADLERPASGNKTIKLSDYRGQRLLLYFFPKASTPGCTQQGQDFRDAIEAFTALNTVILGVSRDGLKAQENFRLKQALPFDLVSDQDEQLCHQFDVIKLKNLYGKQVRGIERSSFLLDEQGRLRRQWRKVKVKGHVEEVLAALAELAD